MFKVQTTIILTGVFILFGLWLSPLYALEQQETQIKVFHTVRDPATLLTGIIPLYGDMANISISGNRLIVRSSADVINEISHLLNEIDTLPQNLMIEVSSVATASAETSQHAITGRISVGNNVIISQSSPYSHNARSTIKYTKDGNIVTASTSRTSRSYTDSGGYKLRVIEGAWASIRTGQVFVNAPSRYNSPYFPGYNTSVQALEVTSGFDVLPILNGHRVTLKIRPMSNAMHRGQAGRINTRSLQTSVSGNLGEWIYLGSAIEQLNHQSHTYALKTNTHTTTQAGHIDSNYKVRVILTK